MKRRALPLLLCLAATAGSASPPASPPALRPGAIRLGGASNFSQGWSEDTRQATLKLKVPRLRDSIRWAEVERTPGRFTFDKPTTTWPDRFAGTGVAITLTLNWGNPLYDDGKTPHSPQALAAFGRFAAATLARFPQIDTLEIGNEVNGQNFVNGPVRDAGLPDRGRYHLAMVQAAAEAVGKVRPDVQVIGGSTHSLPAGFLWPLLERPGASAMEGLALHPYTTPIDQLPAQIGFLRGHGRVRRLPLYITEFGSEDPRRAADDLVRGYTMLAALGITEMDWYPLNERGDGMIPLIRRDGTLTAAGEAFRFVQARLRGRAVRNVSPDPFTFAYAFGEDIVVVWGAVRPLAVDPATVRVFDARGGRVSLGQLELAEDRALILTGTGVTASAPSYRLGCSPLLADSFYQFAYPDAGTARAKQDGFERFLRIDGREMPLSVMPGQQHRAVPWTPYRGRADMRDLRLTAETMLPAVKGGDGAIVHRFRADRDRALRLVATFAVSNKSTDGISVNLARNGRTLLTRSDTAAIRIDHKIALRKGQSVAVALSPRKSTRGDTTRYRIQVFDADKCKPHR